MTGSASGTPGSGGQVVIVGGVVYTAPELLVRMALDFDDSRAIEAYALAEGRWVFRYYDGQDQRLVTLELDQSFRILGEKRDWFPEWSADGECYPQHCGH